MFCAFILQGRKVRRTEERRNTDNYLIVCAVPGKRHRMALFWPGKIFLPYRANLQQRGIETHYKPAGGYQIYS